MTHRKTPKSQRERAVFQAFVEAAPSLTGGTVSQPDPPEPDIAYSLEQRVIGVELTELMGREAVRREEGEQEAVLSRAQSEYESGAHPHPPVSVSVVWAPVLLEKATRAGLVRDLVTIIGNNLPSVDGWVELGRTPDAERQITHEAFERIWIAGTSARCPWESLHQWDGAQADSGFIQRQIARKESKPRHYRASYDEIWLLLFVRGTSPSSGFDLSSEARAAAYRSPFDRLFVLDLLRRSAIELKRAEGAT